MAQLDRIRDALRRRPFEPFIIEMTDGTACTVEGPEWLAIPPARPVREIAFFEIPDRARPGEFHTHWLNLRLISEVIVPGLAERPRPTREADDEA